MSDTNIIAVAFDDDRSPYKALSVLKNIDTTGRVRVLSAAVVERDASGSLRVRDSEDTVTGDGVTGGGLVGMLVGVLGGPLGLLVGFSTGALIGGALDARRADTSQALVAQIGRAVPAGRTVLVAEVDEVAVEVVDTEMTALGGTVLRRPAAEVLDELEAAEDAAEAAQKEANRALREQRRAELKERYEDRKATLRAKLHRD